MTNFDITVKNNNSGQETKTRVVYDTIEQVEEMVKSAWNNATITKAIEINLLTNKRTQII